MRQTKILDPGENLADAYAVRTAVFVEEQGFSAAQEVDATDPVAHHVVLYQDGLPIATGRVFAAGEEPGVFSIGRVAVLSQCRGGTGSALMAALEQQAGRMGATSITLGAQCRVQEFYSKLGYQPVGDVYLDEFCPHIHMVKALTQA